MRYALILLAILFTLGCSSSPSVRCSDRAGECTLRDAAREAGKLVGTTSEGPGWASSELGELVRTHFSSITSQNELKWASLTSAPGVYDFEDADETVAFAKEHGLRVRGHVLFWHRLNGIPAWLNDELEAAEDPQARLIELMTEHVSTVVGRYEGRIETWDVVNEPLELLRGQPDPASPFFQVFDRYEDFLDLAFSLARQQDPTAKLFINEIFPGANEATFDGLLQLVTGMVERGTPIDGVGFQGHFIISLPEREVFRERLQAFADLGLLVEITELDVSIDLLREEPDPLAAQAEVYRDVFTACLQVENCVGITTWNIHDGSTWLDTDSLFKATAPHRPTLFDENLAPKPAYDAARDALATASSD